MSKDEKGEKTTVKKTFLEKAVSKTAPRLWSKNNDFRQAKLLGDKEVVVLQ